MAVPQVLDDAGYLALRDAVRPSADELRWTEIPWETDLWDGVAKAARAGRPIFLWAMNGNPLGCV